MNSRGLAQSCAVLAVNVSNHDITVTDNAMLGSLIKYDAANVLRAGGAVLRAAGAVLRAAGAVLRAAGAVLRAAGAVLRAAGAVLRAAGAVLRAAGAVLRADVLRANEANEAVL